MKCFNHQESDATATCNGCSKGLCATCTGRFNVVLCEPCLIAHNKSISVEMYKGLAITGIIFVLAISFFISMRPQSSHSANFHTAFMSALLLSFSYWGWRFLSAHLPRLTGGTGGVWFLYLWFKFFFSLFIGIIVGPYQIFRHCREISVARNTHSQIKSGEL